MTIQNVSNVTWLFLWALAMGLTMCLFAKIGGVLMVSIWLCCSSVVGASLLSLDIISAALRTRHIRKAVWRRVRWYSCNNLALNGMRLRFLAKRPM